MSPQEQKERCLADLRGALPKVEHRLGKIDSRLVVYANDLIREDQDLHNLDELLAFRKFIRMLHTYPFNTGKVQMVFQAFERLKFSGMHGRQHYPLTPVQCFMLAAVFGFQRADDDPRRVCTDATYYIPRKFCKTTMSAFFAFWFFMFEDYNAEVYCVANSANQSNILFRMAKDLCAQLDPDGKRIRQTATVCEWRKGQSRQSKIEALTAGGKTKDGLFAQLCCVDEYGSAPYINNKSGMGQLVSVVRGSMGPRREPLTLTTTTAGRIDEGPFKDKLEGMVQTLREELKYPLDGTPRPATADWQFAILLHPDEWERDEEHCRQPNVWRKVNPHIGITVQEDYYRDEWRVMDTDEETKRENMCKLFNIYQSSRTREWIAPDLIRRLQMDTRIDDCTQDDGWLTFAGLDFSTGDDLHAVSFLAYRHNAELDRDEFFADMDAWVSRRALEHSPLRLLLERWEQEGWLHVCEGDTIEPEQPVNRCIELFNNGLCFRAFGYDPYKAKTPINALSQWMVDITDDPDVPKEMVLPVRQNFATYNPLVDEMDYMIRCKEPLIRFSQNPMWPWQFGNCVLAESADGMDNHKPVKRDQNSKVDNVQCLLTALHLFDRNY